MVTSNDIGRGGPTYRFPIEEGKVREFAKAIGWPWPDDNNVGSIPPGFFGISGRFWGYTFDDPGQTELSTISIDRSLLLHAEEEFELIGPPPMIGDELAVRTFIKDVFQKEGKRGGSMQFVKVATEYRDPDGNLIICITQTVVKTDH